jgi:hypothetical protein
MFPGVLVASPSHTPSYSAKSCNRSRRYLSQVLVTIDSYCTIANRLRARQAQDGMP